MVNYQIKQINDDCFHITNLDRNITYFADIGKPNKCTCDGFATHKKCKHLDMAKGFKDFMEK